MDKQYLAYGTLQLCSYSREPEIVTFDGETFDKSFCYHDECSDNSCPLCKYLQD